MRDRVRHLEGLVKGAIVNGNMSGVSGHGQGKGEEESRGRVVINEREGENTYVGATHWAAILEDVCFLPSLLPHLT